MTNHKAEAESLTRMLANYDEHTADVAMLHATLYLAEQQKLANEIAAVKQWGGESAGWPYAIKEGLGIA